MPVRRCSYFSHRLLSLIVFWSAMSNSSAIRQDFERLYSYKPLLRFKMHIHNCFHYEHILQKQIIIGRYAGHQWELRLSINRPILYYRAQREILKCKSRSSAVSSILKAFAPYRSIWWYCFSLILKHRVLLSYFLHVDRLVFGRSCMYAVHHYVNYIIVILYILVSLYYDIVCR